MFERTKHAPGPPGTANSFSHTICLAGVKLLYREGISQTDLVIHSFAQLLYKRIREIQKDK